MQKIKSALDMEAYGQQIFICLSAIMIACFITGAVLMNFSRGRLYGLITMAIGLVFGMFIWSVFLAEATE
ncbi:MAG TPA: hypothetical protein VFP32_03940 [Candidatus Saccharimonadales bacterium]|nr:hypothetical protein [Candidatus Saccharimonadales bacterium]